jgi:two-component system chemotaxis response regulator CheY
MKILIVDDDFLTRKILMATLKSMGECDLACSGIEAIDAWEAAQREGQAYDLVLLDIMMPEMDGVEVLRRIRVFEKNKGMAYATKVVMATSAADKDHVIGSFHEGCDGYIVKPFSPESILKDLLKHGVLT